jgi:hypothetical protein
MNMHPAAIADDEVEEPATMAPFLEDGPLAAAAIGTAIALRQKVEKLQRISNVVQALENLLAQSEGQREFESLRHAASAELASARKLLTQVIHSS